MTLQLRASRDPSYVTGGKGLEVTLVTDGGTKKRERWFLGCDILYRYDDLNPLPPGIQSEERTQQIGSVLMELWKWVSNN